MKTTGAIRIIAGQWRRRRLPVPHHPGLRPSPDRVRETLFNWIGEAIRDRDCLDLFAGTGALGFESASRGAARVWLVERDGALCRNLRRQCLLLQAGQVQVVQSDALVWMAGAGEAVDYIFLDPPFGDYAFTDLIDHLEVSRLLKPTTMLYFECALEAAQRLDTDIVSSKADTRGSWHRMHCARAGRVSYNLYQRQPFAGECTT